MNTARWTNLHGIRTLWKIFRACKIWLFLFFFYLWKISNYKLPQILYGMRQSINKIYYVYREVGGKCYFCLGRSNYSNKLYFICWPSLSFVRSKLMAGISQIIFDFSRQSMTFGFVGPQMPQVTFLEPGVADDHRLWEQVLCLKLVLVWLADLKMKKSIVLIKHKDRLFSWPGWGLESPNTQECIMEPKRLPSVTSY